MRTAAKWWIGVALATLATLAIAQQQLNLTGNEVFTVAAGGAGGPGFSVSVNQVRNGNALILRPTGSGAQTDTPTLNTGTLMWTGAAPTTWGITLPNPAFDGEVFTISTDTTLTTMVSVTAGTTPQNQTLAAAYTSQTLTAATSAAWQFNLANLKWFRIR